jgi:WD40 repeat protein
MRTIDVGIGTITYLAFSPDGGMLAVAGDKGVALEPWPELLVKQGRFNIGPSRERVAQIAWHPDGHSFAVALLDTAVLIWNRRMRRPRELLELAGQQGHMLSVAYSPDGTELAIGGGWWQLGSAVIVSTSTWRPLHEIDTHANQVGSIRFLRKNVIATGSADKTVAVHLLSNDNKTTQSMAMPSRVEGLALQPCGRRFAVAAGNQIHLLTLTTDGGLSPTDRLECRGHKHVVKAIDYSPDGRFLASVGEDGTLRFWNADTAAAIASLDLGIGKLRAVVFGPDGLTALAGGDSSTLAIVDVDC